MATLQIKYSELEWFTDSSGEIEKEKVSSIPSEVKEWFGPILEYTYYNLGTYPYLTKTKDGVYGMMATLEFSHPESSGGKGWWEEAYLKGTHLEFAKDGKPLLEYLQKFAATIENETVIVGEKTGFEDNHELAIFVPAFTSLEETIVKVKKLDAVEMVKKLQ